MSMLEGKIRATNKEQSYVCDTRYVLHDKHIIVLIRDRYDDEYIHKSQDSSVRSLIVVLSTYVFVVQT